MPRITAILTLFFLLFVSQRALAASPFHVWSAGYGDTDQQQGYAVTEDSQGNIIMTGFFGSTVNFGGGLLSSGGSYDVFVAKFDRDGNHIWSAGYGATIEQIGTCITVDAFDNIVVGGYFFGSVNFGGGNLTSSGSADIFVAKFTPGGTHLWSKKFGAGGTDFVDQVAVDAGQNIILAGSFQLTVDFGGGGLISAGNSDVYLTKLNSAGNHVWSKRFGDAVAQSVASAGIDASSSVFLAGSFMGSIDFGGGILTSLGQNDLFLARFDSNGNHLWSKRFGDVSAQTATDVAVDASGAVILSGTFYSTTDFGGGPLTSAGGDDLFLAKFTSAGNPLWSARFGDVAVNGTLGVEVGTDAARNIIVAGGFLGSVDFGGGTLTSLGSSEFFHARFSPNGVFLASDRSGDAGGQYARAIAVCADGSAVMTGSNTGTMDLGGGPLVAPGGSADIFLAKFRNARPEIVSIGDVGNDQGKSVRIRLTRSGFDAGGVGTPVQNYAAFRRIDALPAGARADAGRTTGPDVAAPGEQLLAGWDFVGSIPAFADDEYNMIVPTLADSTIVAGPHNSIFFVRAATGNPSVYFDSPPDSGYSTDDLAPGVPANFAFAAGQLSWHESMAADFDYFTVYGSNTNDFGAATVIDYTVPAELDVTGSPYPYYFVSATDFSGNEGLPASLDAATGVGGTPTRYVLSVNNYPNPFNPSTTVSYTVPARGKVTVAIYDARGVRVATLVDNEERAPMGYRTEWNGRADSGAMVSSGIYFARIEQNGATRTRKMVLLK